METTKLDAEKFSTLKELGEVQGNVSLAKAELLKLKETTEEYMVVREREAEERVIEVLKESREALEETAKNHNELSGYSRDLKDYANELNVLASDIEALFKDFNARMRESEGDMEVNHKLVSEVLKQLKIERVNITEDRKMLDRDRNEIRDGWRLLRDRQETLKKGFEELKKLKTKTI